jgi:Na+/proline symporter
MFGSMLLAGFSWLIFRVLAGPNVWDFQFFLTTRSARDASLAAGTWTVGYTLRWIIACAFLVLGIHHLGAKAGFDAEKIMPLVLKTLPLGMQGIFMAVLLAALMSTLSAMINVTSSVVTNDFLARYLKRKPSQRGLVRLGQLASIGAITLGFVFSLSFSDIVSAWETMIFIIVTMILVPSTFRWHWWRFGARAFVWGMVGSALIILAQKVIFPDWSVLTVLAVDTAGSFALTLGLGFLMPSYEMDIFVKLYTRVRPFRVWRPAFRAADRRGLVPSGDPMPRIDMLNGAITVVFQIGLALVPFYFFLQMWTSFLLAIVMTAALAILLYFTWYKNLPSPSEI